MGFVLDHILKKIITAGPETVNADFESNSIDISDREDEFAVTLDYSNGSSVGMSLFLQVSTDNIVFADVDGSEQAITDDTGTHIWDIAGTGATYLRVRIAHSSGSIDIDEIRYTGKRRH